MKPIAVEGADFQWTGIEPMTLASQVISPASFKVKAGGKAAYSGAITINAIFTTTGTPPTLPLAFTINGTATKCNIDGKMAVLEGDMSTPVPWTYTVGSSAVAGSATCKIQAAGQDKVSAN